MAWSPRGNLKGPMGDNLVSSPTLVTDFNDAVNTNGKSQAFSVAGVMANGPPGGLQAYAPVLYLQSYASSTGGPVTRTGMQITFDRFNPGAGNPQAVWIRTVSSTSFGAWLRIVDEDMLTAALAVVSDALNAHLLDTDDPHQTVTQDIANGDTAHAPSGAALFAALADKADDADVVHKTGPEDVAGEKTFLDNIKVATGAKSGRVSVSAEPGYISDFSLEAAGVARWVLRCQNDAETGGNTGSSFSLRSRDDSGSQLNTIFIVDRPTGVLNFPQVAPTILGNKVLTEQDTDSGTYTPTTVNVLNVASSSGGLCTYQRIGNSVDVAGSIIITPTAAGTRTTVQITIPIPSDFNDNTNCGGSAAAARGDYTDIVPCYMQANANNDRLVLSFIPASLGSYSVSFATTYPIL